jgi:hypothetical protein
LLALDLCAGHLIQAIRRSNRNVASENPLKTRNLKRSIRPMYKCVITIPFFLFLLGSLGMLSFAPSSYGQEVTSTETAGCAQAASSSQKLTTTRAKLPTQNEADSPEQKTANLLTGARAPKRQFKVADRKFWALAALQTGATIADFETTQWAERKAPYGTEENPLFGSHPSRARMYSIGFTLTSAQIFLQYRSKRFGERTGKLKHAWIAGALFDTGLHTILAVHNAEIAER